jgi:hypothetical protein
MNKPEEFPLGYGLFQGEWPESQYPTAEIIRSGKKVMKELRVPLDVDVCLLHAVQWVVALWKLTELDEMARQN